jgi:hypothetical protein
MNYCVRATKQSELEVIELLQQRTGFRFANQLLLLQGN